MSLDYPDMGAINGGQGQGHKKRFKTIHLNKDLNSGVIMTEISDHLLILFNFKRSREQPESGLVLAYFCWSLFMKKYSQNKGRKSYKKICLAHGWLKAF